MKQTSDKSFYWHTFSIGKQLSKSIGRDWDSQIIDYAKSELKLTPIIPRSTTSRERNRDSIINTAVINGIKIRNELPWLYELYKNDFLSLAQIATGQNLVCARNDIYGINLNIQQGTSMRYECHIDSNPVQGMLYITTHNKNTGGLLHVANNINANSVEEVNEDCCIINPSKGELVFFDARKHSHYVNALTNNNNIRVAAAMNFYTPTCPESERPKDLTTHLGLE